VTVIVVHINVSGSRQFITGTVVSYQVPESQNLNAHKPTLMQYDLGRGRMSLALLFTLQVGLFVLINQQRQRQYCYLNSIDDEWYAFVSEYTKSDKFYARS